MNRYIAILYNNSGIPSYHPIEAVNQNEAEGIANWLADARQPGSGGTEFVVDVMPIENLRSIANNAAGEKNPFTVKDTEDFAEPDLDDDDTTPDLEEEV